MAVTEALAHIELLHARGRLEKRCGEGDVTYLVGASSAA
jgi:hypothetical protein